MMEEINDFKEDNLINNKKTKNCFKCIFFIIIGNVILIIYVFLIIYYIKISMKSNNDNDNSNNNNETNITQISHNYLMYMKKLAISEKTLIHLFKGNKNYEENYNSLVKLEKEVLKLSWEYLNDYNKNILLQLNENITNFLSLPQKGENNNISNILFRIMIKGENISNFVKNTYEDENIKYIIKELENKEENENMKNKLNVILLYCYVNLPLQFCYFSSNQEIKNKFVNEIYDIMTMPDNYQILNNINKEMGQYPNDSLNMVLGTTQSSEIIGITAKSPETPYINIVNTGLRTQYSVEEANEFLKDNIINYFTKPEYKDIVMQCTGNQIMNEETYDNFVNDCNNLLTNPVIENVIETFGKYNFSIETANTFIIYLKLNISLEDIIIVRLGEKNDYNKIENIKYDENKVYILFNVKDVSQTFYQNMKIVRATTEANAKAIYYLMNEYNNFFTKEQYNKIVLVSKQYYSERQLEVFNILSNIFDYRIEFNSVIWNQKYTQFLTYKNISDCFLEIIVKSSNLISTSIKEFNINEYNNNKNENLFIINQFIKEILSFTDRIK